MALFGKKNSARRCPDCKHYAMIEGYGYCAKALPATVDFRMVSGSSLKRQCPRCPAEMTCADWSAK